MLTIHLGQDEADCFSAWVSARDAGLAGCVEPDQKVNYGKLLLQALLEHWRGVEADPDSRRLYFSVPPHTPLIFRYKSASVITLLFYKATSFLLVLM